MNSCFYFAWLFSAALGLSLPGRQATKAADWTPVLANEFVQVSQATRRASERSIGGIAGDSPNGYLLIEMSQEASPGRWKFDRARFAEIEKKSALSPSVASGVSRTIWISLLSVPSVRHFEIDAARVDPKHNEVKFENKSVRVVSVRFKPGESGPIVDKRPRVIILLNDMHAVVTLPDGHSEPRDGKAGTVYWGNAGAQATKNVGDKPFENIVVELKGK